MSTFVREETNIKKIISYLYISIIPLLIFGFYKNGIKSYDGIYILHPLILDLVGFASGALVSIILEKKKPLTSFYPFYGILSASLVFPNTSIIVFGLICFISLFIYKKINKNNVNIVCVIALIVILISNFYETSYLNLVINTLIADPLLILGLRCIVTGILPSGDSSISSCNISSITGSYFLIDLLRSLTAS